MGAVNIYTRFLRQADTRGMDPDACWEWRGPLNSNGYGRFATDNRQELAHRVAFRLFRGEVPAGMNVCHACDNRLCVNPDHLWAGTQSENLLDAVAKGRMVPPNVAPEDNGNAKLQPPQVAEIRAAYRDGVLQRVLATRFRVSVSTISGIVNNKTWKEAPNG